MPEAAQIALRAELSHQHNTTTSTSRVTSVGYYRISFMDQGLDRRSSYIKTRAPIEATMGGSYSGRNTAGMMDSRLLVVLPASVLL
jgi:hypothetical protein